ncbi:MAG: hypothetical protein M1817_001906 [Caeruleum heppii]|nr:MAG: hypothetical protein M1817_001906 [Caeruleum heppii]
MSTAQPKVLIVLTSHNKMGNTGKPTGWYLVQFAHPYNEMHKHAQISIASPAGGEAPLDPSSVEMSKGDQAAMDFLNNKSDLWKGTEKLSSFVGKAKDFDAIFYVGGHGPMFDLATDETSHQLIREFFESDKVVAAVCHGPAALLNAKLSDGSYLIANSSVTGFSNAEEDSVGLSSAMPFMLEDELNKKSGGKYQKAKEPWAECVTTARGGRLITGQNPASAGAIGKAILKAISN